MIWLLKYWKLIAVAGIVALSNFATYRYVHSAWDADKARASLKAEQAARTIEAANARAAYIQAETTRDLEKLHNEEIEKLRANGAVVERGYADSLRAVSQRLGQCRGTTEALGAIVAADSAREREDRLQREVAADFREVGERANELAATVRLCVSWANSVGR